MDGRLPSFGLRECKDGGAGFEPTTSSKIADPKWSAVDTRLITDTSGSACEQQPHSQSNIDGHISALCPVELPLHRWWRGMDSNHHLPMSGPVSLNLCS